MKNEKPKIDASVPYMKYTGKVGPAKDLLHNDFLLSAAVFYGCARRVRERSGLDVRRAYEIAFIMETEVMGVTWGLRIAMISPLFAAYGWRKAWQAYRTAVDLCILVPADMPVRGRMNGIPDDVQLFTVSPRWRALIETMKKEFDFVRAGLARLDENMHSSGDLHELLEVMNEEREEVLKTGKKNSLTQALPVNSKKDDW